MHQAIADTMKCLQVLAFKALHWDKSHSWPISSFEDRLRVCGVVFGAAHEGLDEEGVDQAHGPTGSLKKAPPMMSVAAGFHRDDLRVGSIHCVHELRTTYVA